MRSIPLSEVQEHGPNHQDPWLIVSGKVISVAEYKDEHPGGDEVLLKYAGKDATKQFEDVGHSGSARSEMANYVVGDFDATTATTSTNASSDVAANTTTEEKKECSIQ